MISGVNQGARPYILCKYNEYLIFPTNSQKTEKDNYLISKTYLKHDHYQNPKVIFLYVHFFIA
jgi:hypothetical protein